MLEMLILGQIPGTDIYVDSTTVLNIYGALIIVLLSFAFVRYNITKAAKTRYYSSQAIEKSL